MAKKNLNAENAFDKVWSNEETQTTQETSTTQKTQVTQETPKKAGRPVERPDTYRFSLYLDGDLKDYIKYISWKQQKSITQYLNDIIRAEMAEYVASGGDESEWMKK